MSRDDNILLLVLTLYAKMSGLAGGLPQGVGGSTGVVAAVVPGHLLPYKTLGADDDAGDHIVQHWFILL